MKKYICACLACSCLFAKNFGPRGEAFQVEEEDMISVFKKQAELFDVEAFAENLKKSMMNPRSFSRTTTAVEKKSRLVDMRQTRIDGQQVNPLESLELEQGLLFIDGRDPKQIEWAKKQGKGFLWILVRGSPMELQKKGYKEIYFDQYGFFEKVLEIEHVPAKVTQKGRHFLIEEEPPR
jgi:conjugal transfer pilus assembly protein TraW